MSIITFITASPRFLAFGFTAAFFSSFGQTYFIALSGAEIRSAFDLSHADFGMIYSAATLSSAALLIWAGRKIDDVDLRPYTCAVGFGLAMACLGMAAVGWFGSALWLLPVIFGLRFTGQGLLTHIATTSMARYFDAHRGKAISVASMGFPLGEALLPIIAVGLIATYGWRETWTGIGALLALGLVPLVLWLLKGHGERHRALQETARQASERGAPDGWSRSQLLRDPRFYVLLPAILASSFIITGFFFHQVHLVEVKGWTMTWFAATFVAFAAAQIVAALVTGVLVDRYGAVSLIRFDLLPVMAGLIVLAAFDGPWVAVVFMVLMGLTSGAAGVIHSAVWAEVYGVAHLGAIKALAASLMVLASALSPPIMGWTIDADITMDTIAVACTIYSAVAVFLLFVVLPRMGRS